jgi:nicotinamidase-related amidase
VKAGWEAGSRKKSTLAMNVGPQRRFDRAESVLRGASTHRRDQSHGFPGAEDLLPSAAKAAQNIVRLKQRARDAGIPAIYVNDNFNCWHLGFRELTDRFQAADVPGLPIIQLLNPELQSDYYILKPSHSGFFHTGLKVLLERLKTRTTVLTGFATDICVLFTANDAYMRGFEVVVPRDCVASECETDHDHALRHMERLLKADIVCSPLLDLDHLRRADSPTEVSPGQVLRP